MRRWEKRMGREEKIGMRGIGEEERRKEKNEYK